MVSKSIEKWKFCSWQINFHYLRINLRPSTSLYCNPKAGDYWIEVFDLSRRIFHYVSYYKNIQVLIIKK